MKKLSYDLAKNYENVQFIDLRGQSAFQEGHLKNSLNLNLKNYGKYGKDLLEEKKDIVLIIDGNSRYLLDEFEETFGGKSVLGCLMNEEIEEKYKETTSTISPNEFIENSGDYILLDVRHPDEITRPAPEKNLVNIPLENLNTQLDELDHSKEIYTLCGSGNRATTTASYLAANNFNPTVIEGGMKGMNEL